MRPLPLWYSTVLILVGVVLLVPVGGSSGIIFIAGGMVGLLLKLCIRQLDRRRARRR